MIRFCLLAAAGALAVLAQPAQACIGDIAEEALIHSDMPAELPTAMVVLQVRIDVNNWGAIYEKGLAVHVTRVLRGGFAGRTALLRLYTISDCDHLFVNGRRGILVGMVRGEEDGVPVVEPYTVSRSDGFRITADNPVAPEWLEPPEERIRKWFANLHPIDP